MKCVFRYLIPLILLLSTSPISVEAHSSPLKGTEVFPAGARPAPSFALRDQSGQPVTLRGLRGRLVALTFLDSKCRQACPVAAGNLARVQAALGRHTPLTVVVVSVAPGVDTPRTVHAFMKKAHLHGPWHWLLGTKWQLTPVWLKYGIYVKDTRTDILHTSAVFLIDKHGSVRVADSVPLIAPQFIHDVRVLAHR
ncbi:MAG: SCO family protein [Chloroflexota bacterium]